jgi:homocysteine S-methyltransferase
MRAPFLESLGSRVLVCDGAMGTMLYAQGVFINRSFDSLNISDPDRVLAVHREYVRAGADVLETNTFAANRLKLQAFGLADQLAAINQAGARVAREAAGERVYVAGAIGPLGLRIEPWGRMGRDEAQAFFEEQAAALAEGGVDLFVLETFRDLNEIRSAVAAVRRISTLPIVAQMTTEDDGNSLDGTTPEHFAPALLDAGADVIGLNCSIGPAHMLETLERMAATGAPLSAQPNAGRPRDVEGRTIYLTSPDYMASYARRFAERGVRMIGGCCGTTPDHIAAIKAALMRTAPRRSTTVAPSVGTVDAGRTAPVEAPAHASVPAGPRTNALRDAFDAGRSVRLVEIASPRGHDTAAVLAQARQLRDRRVDAVHVPDAPIGARMSALSLAVLLQQQAGLDVVLQYASRDKPLLAIESDLLGAFAMGVRNLLAVTGAVRAVGDYPDATAVVDVDSIGLANAVARLNQGLDVGGQPIGPPTAFHLGVTVNPTAEDLETEIRRFEYKVEAGANYVVTRPVFDVSCFERIHRRIEGARLPIVVTLRPFAHALDAEYMANEVPGVQVPGSVLERMRRAAGEAAVAAEGVAIAAEVGRRLAPAVHGINIATPSGRFDMGIALLDQIGDRG